MNTREDRERRQQFAVSLADGQIWELEFDENGREISGGLRKGHWMRS